MKVKVLPLFASMKSLIQKPVCQHFKACSGCTFDLNNLTPEIWNEVQAYFQEKGITPTLYTNSSIEWRYRAKLAVRGMAASPAIGLFKEGSHDVIPIPHCRIHHPHINEAVEKIRHLMMCHQLRPYQEETGQGDLRYIQLVVERETGKVQASFVLNAASFSDPTYQRWKLLIEQMGEIDHQNFWHSLWINVNAKKTNTIFGTDWQLIWGEELLWETLGGISVCFQPANFAQANLNLFDQMLGHIHQCIPNQSKVVEFYAGVGVIGLSIASKCLSVKCGEINSCAEACFAYSKNKLSPSNAEKLSFHTGSTHQLLDLMQGADVIIVDPPRKGLDRHLLHTLNKPSCSIKQMIYISCGWSSFKEDCMKLIENGWRLTSASGYLFFPGSNHIETLAIFLHPHAKKSP